MKFEFAGLKSSAFFYGELMFETAARGILLDIEGTTSSISFVYDSMFPFVREHSVSFISDHWGKEAVQKAVELLAMDLGFNSTDSWFKDCDSESAKQAIVVAGIVGLMDADVKATGLKQIQGVIWKEGFHRGELVAHLYEDVAGSIRQWNELDKDVRIYSSGSIQAQQLFFGHTVAGDLLDMFKGHYDTTTGAKQDSASYQEIAKAYGLNPREILFVSDVVGELVAAKTAGLQVVLSIRPGNKPVESGHGFPEITSFREIICVN